MDTQIISLFGKIRGILNNSCKVENKSHSTAGKTADESRTADRTESLFEVQITERAGKPESGTVCVAECNAARAHCKVSC